MEEDVRNVTIVSYGHANGPLIIPKEHEKLFFSVRDIPNPAAGLRKTHTGLSARLRKEVLASKEAQERLTDMIKAVGSKMDEMEEESIASPKAKGGSVVHQKDISASTDTLVIGIACEEGRHRSVTFAAELGHSLKRRDWDVTIDHRDLTGYANPEPDTPTDATSPTIARPKTKKQKNQESRKRKTSQKGFLNDEE